MNSLHPLLQTLTVFVIPVLFAISLHEAAHGYVARLCGDPTASQKGRVSINPFRHIDPLGTVMLPLFAYWLLGLPFGYAKPVPVNYSRLRKPRRDIALVAIAGPLANLAMGACWALLGVLLWSAGLRDPLWQKMASAGVLANATMFVFNMMPVPPLDGGEIVLSLIPPRMADKFDALRDPFGDPRRVLRRLREKVPEWLAVRIVRVDVYGVCVFAIFLLLLKFHVLDGPLNAAVRFVARMLARAVPPF